MPDRVRLGHAMRAELSEEAKLIRRAVAIATGADALQAREPQAAECVYGAEETLDARPSPIYAFVGDLNPALGVLGLVFAVSWFERAPQGLSRCDTGGLFCGKGGFAAEPDLETRKQLLRSLSSEATCTVSDWREHFRREIEEHHDRGIHGYVEGEDPRYREWDDPRARFLEHADRLGIGAIQDRRRLWTWETRMSAPPRPDELQVVVLSSQLTMHRDPEFMNEDFPHHIAVIEEDFDATGVHFLGARTRAALLGDMA